MKTSDYIIKTPWDSKVFGIDTYEIKSVSKKVLEMILNIKGHFTVKVNPLSSKKLLYDYGFYYCDTLIESYCTADEFVYFKHDKTSISTKVNVDNLISISHGAFYGRFHKDFNIDKECADLRYDQWLKELYNAGNVFGLIFDGELAGFIGFSGKRIVLSAVDGKYKGKELAKYLWSTAYKELFNMGHDEISSSISVSNSAMLNLSRSLGFKFRNPVDVYHKLAK